MRQVRSLEGSIPLAGPLSPSPRTCGAIDPRAHRQACQTDRGENVDMSLKPGRTAAVTACETEPLRTRLDL